MKIIALLAVAAFLAGCQTESQREAERRREEQDSHSAAYKAGEAAHKVADEAARVAAVAGRKLDEGARKAQEGWEAQQRKERDKK